jgi:2-keto-4-pentenoate hydratase
MERTAEHRVTPEAIEEAAAILLKARRNGLLIPGLPEHCRPRSLDDAYAVQDRVFEGLNEATGGWFVGCSNPAIQEQLGLNSPYFARLPASTIQESPASLDSSRFPTITLEVEFAFRLAGDLPPRSKPYGLEEVAAAVATLHPAIEVVTSHLKDWTRQPIFSLIADNGTDGALVIGAGLEDWRGLDLGAATAELHVDGNCVRRGNGTNVMGDPLKALVWLANACSAKGTGLIAGHVHNTGSCTEMYLAQPGDLAVARFGGLGEAEVHF